jgi:hypothetical protein
MTPSMSDKGVSRFCARPCQTRDQPREAGTLEPLPARMAAVPRNGGEVQRCRNATIRDRLTKERVRLCMLIFVRRLRE